MHFILFYHIFRGSMLVKLYLMLHFIAHLHFFQPDFQATATFRHIIFSADSIPHPGMELTDMATQEMFLLRCRQRGKYNLRRYRIDLIDHIILIAYTGVQRILSADLNLTIKKIFQKNLEFLNLFLCL